MELMTPPAPGTAAPSRRRTWLIVAAAAAVVLLLAGGVFAFVRPRPAPVSAPAPLRIYGTVQLDIVAPAWRLGSECATASVTKGRGYEDIRAGAPVTVTDPAGKVVALGQVGVGLVAVHPTIGDPAKTCLFGFEVFGVPAGLGFYGVEVTHRGRVQFAEQALAESLALTLGS